MTGLFPSRDLVVFTRRNQHPAIDAIIGVTVQGVFAYVSHQSGYRSQRQAVDQRLVYMMASRMSANFADGSHWSYLSRSISISNRFLVSGLFRIKDLL